MFIDYTQACMHCVGQAGCGRYFPASEASLSQTTTSQTIINHVRNCRRCPEEIRESLELMRRAKFGPSNKNSNKPKHGGRKVFFHRLWCRIQRIEIDGEEDIVDYIAEKAEMRKALKTSQKKKSANALKLKKKRTATFDSEDLSSNEGEEGKGDNSDTESDIHDGSESTGNEGDDEVGTRGTGSNSKHVISSTISVGDDDGESHMNYAVEKPAEKLSPQDIIFISVPLSKSDDRHSLSQFYCFVRSELCEVFSAKKKDIGTKLRNKNVVVGQVGVRCALCATLPHKERPKGHAYFPNSLSSIHHATRDLIIKHFSTCTNMSDKQRSTFHKLKKISSNKSEESTQRYWIDSAKELGLRDLKGGGIFFKHNPNSQTPVDSLRRFFKNKHNEDINLEEYIISPKDRGQMTDFIALLLLQVKRCRFNKGDIRKGTGAHRRDRKIGYPGLACIHCADKNNFGRLFPYSVKGLTEYTTRSLHAHVNFCDSVPEEIKSSLSFLSHKRLSQKTELKSGWKRSYYKKLWHRLHDIISMDDEQDYSGAEEENTEEDAEAQTEPEPDPEPEPEPEPDVEVIDEDETETTKSTSVLGNSNKNMNSDDDKSMVDEDGYDCDVTDIINEAALWLWENDLAAAPTKTKGGRGMGRGGGRGMGRGRGRGRGRSSGRGRRQRARLA